MHRSLVPALLALIVLLAACGGSPAATTPAQVASALQAAGATNLHDEPLGADVPVPKSYTAHQAFTIPALGDKGGQFFVCDSQRNCDAIYAYFDALKALAGPYLYKNTSGTVVVQLNSGLTPDQAKPFQQAIEALP